MSKQILEFRKGDRIISEGGAADCAFMILKGKIRVFLEKDSKIVDLAMLGENEIFGETAIFRGERYSASVSAIEDCSLLVITPDSLSAMLDEADPILRSLIRMLMSRLKATSSALLKSETREFMDIALI